MNLDSVLGGKFSIISKSGVRYVGSLLGIEGEQKTLSFEKVVSFGSEGRIGNGRDIPPSNNVFDFIIFKAEEIAHLKLIEPPPKPPQNEIFTDPAIVQTGPKSTPVDNSSFQNNTRPSFVQDQNKVAELAPVDSFPHSSQEAFPSDQPSYTNNGSERFVDNKNAPKDFNGNQRNNHNKNGPRQNQRNGPRNNRGKQGLTIPDSDFDFQAFNAQFNKEELKKEFSEFGPNSNDGVSQDTRGFYDKKTSFFDNISCDSKNKAEGQNGDSFGFPRKNNYETFGINSNYNRNRNNNGGYRGSRGRGNNNSRNHGQGSTRNNPNNSRINSTGMNGEKSFFPSSTEQ